MKRTSTAVLILLLMVAGTIGLTGTAVAQHAQSDWGSGKGHPDMGQGRMHNRMMAPRGGSCDMPGHRMKRGGGIGALLKNAEKLDLSDSQKDQLENLKFEFQMARIDQEAAIKKSQARLMRLKRDDTAPKAEVMEAIDLAAGAKAEMQKMRYSHRLEIKASLTKEQLEKLKELRLQERSGPDGEKMKKGKRGKSRPRSRSGG